MRPTLPSNHAIDAVGGNAKAQGHAFTGFAARMALADSAHIVFGEDGVGVLAANMRSAARGPFQDLEGVDCVCGVGNHFEVADTVVIFDAVDVIDAHSFGDCAQECFDHDTVQLLGDVGFACILNAEYGVPVLIATALHEGASPSFQEAFGVDGIAGAVDRVAPTFICDLHARNYTGLKGQDNG